MAHLRQDYREFVDRDTEIIAIGPEDKKSFAQWWKENDMPFIGIGDPQHLIADLYGQQTKLMKLGRMPAMLIVDKSGNIRFKHLGKYMSDIPENQRVLAIIDALNVEHQAKKSD
jgi:peroxiredoxin